MGGTESTATSTSGFNEESYYYPAELLYFGNSPIWTSTEERTSSQYPNGVGTGQNGSVYQWHNATAWTGWGKKVSSSTRSVAMTYDINYGTALLRSQVKYGATTLKDNNHVVQSRLNPDKWAPGTQLLPEGVEPDKEIEVDDNDFELTGIIIGGQYQNVGWDFIPRGAGDGGRVSGFIYDSYIPNKTITVDAGSGYNYTMVFDNFYWESKTDAGYYVAYQNAGEGINGQEKVYVALEFKNCTGQDFYGNYNMIAKDGYFYLIGELDPNKVGKNAQNIDVPDWPAEGWYVLPPYNNSGQSVQIHRVFMQDYMTSVTFMLGENSLKHAYLTVPDLRSGSISLGLSVDLKWSEGLVFDNVILGGTE
jgi:hypothetical protein